MIGNETKQLITEEIRTAIEDRVARLRAAPGRCQQCPEGTCEYFPPLFQCSTNSSVGVLPVSQLISQSGTQLWRVSRKRN